EEKDVMKELSRFAKEKVEAGKYMAVWGKTEHSDIEDITEKYLVLFEQFAKFHSDLIERYDCYRAKLKDMKSREDGLYILRKRLTELQGKYKEAIKRQKPTEALRAELESLDRDCNESGAAYEGFKRAIFKEAMHMQFDAWMDFGRKIMVFAQFGKYLSDQIPQGSLAPGQPLPAYEGAPVTTRIVNDFLKAL
ncbi:Eisosome component PIL1/LSP1, partial [Gaertneriomyces semiglobifer]